MEDKQVFICENCGKEHDGSYGSGRFCSNHCRHVFNGKKAKGTNLNHPDYTGKIKKDGWKCNFCGQIFSSRRKLQNHRKDNHLILNENKYQNIDYCHSYCKYCGKEFFRKSAKTNHENHFCNLNPNRIDISEKCRKVQEQIYLTTRGDDLRIEASNRTVFNNFWEYRSKHPIYYKTKDNCELKLDSLWEKELAIRLDSLNLKWVRNKKYLNYIDNRGIKRKYYPDFYLVDYDIYIEVKSPFISEVQNINGKIDFLKNNYKNIVWIETLDDCKNFII